MPSASTTFPLAQSGTFTEISGSGGIKYQEIIPVYQHTLDPVTGSVGGVTDVSHVLVHGVPVVEFIGVGVVNSTGQTYGLAQSSTVTIGTVTAQFTSFGFTKYWPLDDVTNSSTKEWVHGIPILGASLRGASTGAAGPVSATTSLSSFTLAINDFGSLALSTNATFKIDSFRYGVRMGRGGAVGVDIGGRYSGPGGVTNAVAYTGSAFSWLFATPDDPVRGVITLDSDGETLTPTVILHSIRFENHTSRGGAIRVTARMRLDKV